MLLLSSIVGFLFLFSAFSMPSELESQALRLNGIFRRAPPRISTNPYMVDRFYLYHYYDYEKSAFNALLTGPMRVPKDLLDTLKIDSPKEGNGRLLAGSVAVALWGHMHRSAGTTENRLAINDAQILPFFAGFPDGFGLGAVGFVINVPIPPEQINTCVDLVLSYFVGGNKEVGILQGQNYYDNNFPPGVGLPEGSNIQISGISARDSGRDGRRHCYGGWDLRESFVEEHFETHTFDQSLCLVGPDQP